MIDDDGDGVADHVHTVIDDKETPNGIAWRKGSLFVAQIGQIWRYDDVDRQAIKGKVLLLFHVTKTKMSPGMSYYLWTTTLVDV